MQHTTNDLQHKISINTEDANCLIEIRLSAQCRNGHEDFAITATFWEVGKRRADQNHLVSGCFHDKILSIRPDLRPFVDLHLCDVDGMPLYPVENGLYFRAKLHEFLKVPKELCIDLILGNIKKLPLAYKENGYTKEQAFAFLLKNSEIPAVLKQKADSAIKLLEAMTGKKFVPSGQKRHFDPEKYDL